MSRVQLSEAIFAVNPNFTVSVPASGSVTVYERAGTALATVWSSSTGGTALPNPRPVTNGYATGYVDMGSYDLVASANGQTGDRVEWEASRADSVVTRAHVWLDPHDYGAVGDTPASYAADTTGWNNAITAASALAFATAEGKVGVRGRMGVTYYTDCIIPKSNVVLDGTGTINKKARDSTDSQATSSMMRTLEAAVDAGYGDYENIEICNWTFDTNGKLCGTAANSNRGAVARLLYVDGLTVTNCRWLNFAAGSWALNYGGRNVEISHNKIFGGDALYEDGLHCSHGQHIRVFGNHVESGDDCYAFGGETVGDPYLAGIDTSGAVNLVNTLASITGVATTRVRGTRRLSDQRFKNRLFDDFLGITLNADIWGEHHGVDDASAPALVADEPLGVVRLPIGVDGSGNTMASDGVQLWSALGWKASQNGLTFECRLRLTSAAGIMVFAGFTDQKSALEMPFSVGSSNALTSNASNGLGFVYDTDADDDNWWCVGVKDDADATKQNTGSPPVGNTFDTLRFEVTPAGAATFYLNGNRVSTAMANAVSASAPLCPVIAASRHPTGLTKGYPEVDYILVEQTR